MHRTDSKYLVSMFSTTNIRQHLAIDISPVFSLPHITTAMKFIILKWSTRIKKNIKWKKLAERVIQTCRWQNLPNNSVLSLLQTAYSNFLLYNNTPILFSFCLLRLNGIERLTFVFSSFWRQPQINGWRKYYSWFGNANKHGGWRSWNAKIVSSESWATLDTFSKGEESGYVASISFEKMRIIFQLKYS